MSDLLPVAASATRARASIRVVVADGDVAAREGLCDLLANSQVEVVGQARSIPEAVQQVRALRPDVVVLRFAGSAPDAMSAVNEIQRAAPGVAITLLCGDPAFLVTMLHRPVSFLARDISREDLLAAVEAASQGRTLVDRAALIEAIAALKPAAGAAGPHEAEVAPALTPREREVLSLLSGGRTNQAIAEELSLSVGTVKVHVCNILTKLGLTDRVQAAVWATQHGLGPGHLEGSPRPRRPRRPTGPA